MAGLCSACGRVWTGFGVEAAQARVRPVVVVLLFSSMMRRAVAMPRKLRRSSRKDRSGFRRSHSGCACRRVQCHSTRLSSCHCKIARDVSSVPLLETIISGRPRLVTIYHVPPGSIIGARVPSACLPSPLTYHLHCANGRSWRCSRCGRRGTREAEAGDQSRLRRVLRGLTA